MEVDLVIDRNGRLYPMKIESTSTIIPAHTENLNNWKKLAGDLAGEGVPTIYCGGRNRDLIPLENGLLGYGNL